MTTGEDKNFKRKKIRMRSLGEIWIRISGPRSLESWYIKGTVESFPRVNSPVPMMHQDPSGLGSLILIQIIPKKRTLREWMFRRDCKMEPKFLTKKMPVVSNAHACDTDASNFGVGAERSPIVRFQT